MPKMHLIRWLSVSVWLALGGCAAPSQATPATTAADPPAVTVEARAEIIRTLYQQHDEWAGTPYRLGGTGRSGTDCSGFVQRTFETRFGQSLPRTTEALARVGKRVSPDRIEPGDLLFFQTGGKTRHVGIYVENGRFLHASTSQGVTLSGLDNPYWASTFWMARRP